MRPIRPHRWSPLRRAGPPATIGFVVAGLAIDRHTHVGVVMDALLVADARRTRALRRQCPSATFFPRAKCVPSSRISRLIVQVKHPHA